MTLLAAVVAVVASIRLRREELTVGQSFHVLATRFGNNTYVEFDRPPRHIAAGENISVAALPFPRQYGFPLFDPECDGPSCCSDGCFVYWIGDRMCDPKCNVKNCHFDNGDCR